ncbi:hypothetical protein [Nocardia sp. CA-135398]|uniref:hypothetical protein n=1 Tax=Nocardia sp. CA-135398 TaxID=3239977 RepID=UPI003D98D4BE
MTTGHPRPRPPLAETSRIADERAVVDAFLQAARTAGGPPEPQAGAGRTAGGTPGYRLVAAEVNW